MPYSRYSYSRSPWPYSRYSYSRSPSPYSRYRYSGSPSPYSRYRRSVSRSLSRSRSRSVSRDVENPGNNLYVTGLSARITRRDLEKHFSKEGEVVDVHLVTDPWTRESRGFGFVTMATIRDADRCIKYLDRTVLEGRVITVEKVTQVCRQNNSPEAQRKCITRLLLYHFCVNLPVMIFSYPVFKFMGMRSSLPLPSWNVVLTQVIFYFILEDFVFYWGHRILHTKWLYKHVHSIHHEYATPFGLTSEYAHPAEILFLGFATILGPAITGPHLVTLWLWMVLRVLETVEAHCGYHFPWSLSNFIPLYGGADFHDYHHRLLYTKSGNYSSTFTYMDWIFGTDKGYRKLKALKSVGEEEECKQL